MDGWETRRKRTEGHDWCVIATNTKSTPSSAAKTLNDVVGIELDTAYFTGNQAPRISIEVANCTTTTDDMESKVTWMPGAIQRLANGGGIQGTGQTPQQIQTAQAACDQFTWKTILPMTPLQPGYEETKMHYFMLDDATRALAKGFTHVKINYFPDGGVARMKLWGFVNSDEEDAAAGSERCSGSSSTSSEDGDSGLINEMKEKIIPSSLPYHHPELSLSTNGGVGLKCSNKHYGEPDNLIRPTYGKDM
jgi:allantoicase